MCHNRTTYLSVDFCFSEIAKKNQSRYLGLVQKKALPSYRKEVSCSCNDLYMINCSLGFNNHILNFKLIFALSINIEECFHRI